MISGPWVNVGLLLMLISGISGLRILNPSSLNCTQQKLRCNVTFGNCLDRDWLIKENLTPTPPRDLEVSVDVKEDENGDRHAVLVAHWRAQADGSIHFLKGTRVHVLHLATNTHLCMTYIFLDKFNKMWNPSDELWSFSTEQMILEPEQQYSVTVYNLPESNLGHTSNHVTKNVSVKDCTDTEIKTTKACVDIGYLWSPQITAIKSKGPSNLGTLTVSFIPAKQSDHYRVTLKCGVDKSQILTKANNTMMKAVYDLSSFPLTCCNFDFKIVPFFPSCSKFNDCVRRVKHFSICQAPTNPTPTTKEKIPDNPANFIAIIAGLLFTCAIACSSAWVFLRCQKRQKVKVYPPPTITEPLKPAPRTVLVIYSQDHRLYTDIVLKLCAFLRAKCATEVVVDLLDTAWLGTVGRLPWLEQQRQRIDKVLILCSRGMRAKWDAMCGQRPVTLREDVHSPNDDMTTAAFNLILPDLQRAASLGKYLVAYFDEVSNESDVPSVFNIAIRYRLMKHFEEFFFRIQDMEKYQPGRVNTIEGLSMDDYFNCPSGQALKEAIEAFRAYQLENPDWFEKECVSCEEEAIAEREPFDTSLIPPMLKCEPLANEGSPILIHEVDICPREHPMQRVHELTPEVNQSSVGTYVQELDLSHLPGNQPQVHLIQADVSPYVTEGISGVNCLISHQPHLGEKPVLQEVCVQGEQTKNEDAQPSVSLSYNKPSFQALQQLLALQQCLTPLDVPVPPILKAQHPSQPSLAGGPPQPVELAEDEREYAEEEAEEVRVVENVVMGDEVLVVAGVEKDSGKRQSHGSDQGYGSRETPTAQSPPPSALMALAALQNSLFMASPRTSGFGSGTATSTDEQQYSPSNEYGFGN